jgi:hypothetical protein
MGIFLQLTDASDKTNALSGEVDLFRSGEKGENTFIVETSNFESVSGSPFCYSTSPELLQLFQSFGRFADQATPCRGISTLDDFRFVRCWWEISHRPFPRTDWVTYSKGEENTPFYDGLRSVVKWYLNGKEVKSFVEAKVGSASRTIQSQDKYFRPGITWVRRTFRLCLRPLPAGAIFSGGAQAIFVEREILAYLGLAASSIFDALTKVSVGRTGDAVQFEPGMLAKVPTPIFDVDHDQRAIELARKVRRAWSLQRMRDSKSENSPAFTIPEPLWGRIYHLTTSEIQSGLLQIQEEIDAVAFDIYGFSGSSKSKLSGPFSAPVVGEASDENQDERLSAERSHPELLSWAVGVAFGRFDWRLATCERDVPPEPDPFDPLPAKSPGMLPDDTPPFHAHHGILVDNQGHPHDLPRLIEEILARVKAEAPGDVRRWLQRDFFPLHLKQYSKSGRKAPIYWPLSSASGSYTLWLYYPSLTSQTLYTTINDFIEPKLKQVAQGVISLRSKGSARSRDDEKEFESLQSLEAELTAFRDMLLEIAPTYHPNHDDGAQITAAPLWRLFRHKPWQKILKDTWATLEKGDYDWAHLAMAYWPERVRKKCKADKSLAIAHDLEHLYEEPAGNTGAARGRKKAGDAG